MNNIDACIIDKVHFINLYNTYQQIVFIRLIMRTVPEDKIKQKLHELNPHWHLGKIDVDIGRLIKRRYFDLFFPLASQFSVTRAVILMGPRRVGKTVMLQQAIQEFIDKGKNPKDIVYIPIDVTVFYTYNLEDLIDFYKQAVGISDIADKIIIFDEVQSLDGWDRQLKTLVDQFKHTKFIASGSAAGALKRKSHESGAGRFVDFMLPPLTFCEYLELLNLTSSLILFNEYGNKATSSKDINKLNAEFINYLNYGGFPETIFNQDIRNDPTKFIRESIVDKVIQKDLPSIYGISNVRELDNFFHYLIYQTGNEISYQKLCEASGISKPTIVRYIEFLEAAFLIRVIKRVDENGTRMKRNDFLKVYLTNPSMYSALWGLLSNDDPDTLGHLVETAIFSQWVHDPTWIDRLYYSRFKRGDGEVDMVHLGQDLKINWCLEVKWSDLHVDRYNSELSSLLRFCEKNKIQKAHITTKSIHKNITTNNIELAFREAALVCFNIGHNLIYNSNLG